MMGAVRDEAGEDVFVLACGAPLGPCIQYVDGMRVSADAATEWLPTGIDVRSSLWPHACALPCPTPCTPAHLLLSSQPVAVTRGGDTWR